MWNWLPSPLKPLCHDRFDSRGEPGPVVDVTDLADGFSNRRVGMDRVLNLAQADLVFHGEGDFSNHVSGVGTDNGSSHDLVGAFLYMNFNEALGFSREDCAIYATELLGKALT